MTTRVPMKLMTMMWLLYLMVFICLSDAKSLNSNPTVPRNVSDSYIEDMPLPKSRAAIDLHSCGAEEAARIQVALQEIPPMVSRHEPQKWTDLSI
jgi:hypothetical protein